MRRAAALTLALTACGEASPPSVPSTGENRLESPADCRVVYFAGGMKLEIEFILDADATQLLFAWRVPEG